LTCAVAGRTRYVPRDTLNYIHPDR